MNNFLKFFIGLGIFFIIVIYIIFGPYALIKGIGNVAEYHRNKDNVIEIPAHVSYIEDSNDGEGGTDYYHYITYTYNDRQYNNVYWKRTGYSNSYAIGSPVTVKISPSKPDEIFRSGLDNYTDPIFPFIFTIMGIFAGVVTFLSIHNPDFGNKKNA